MSSPSISSVNVITLELMHSSGFGTNMIFTPLAADMSVVVDALDREQSGIFGDAGAYAQAYGLFDGALAAGTVFGPAFAGLMYHKIGWAAAAGALAVVCVTGTLPVVRIPSYENSVEAGLIVWQISYTGGLTKERPEVDE